MAELTLVLLKKLKYHVHICFPANSIYTINSQLGPVEQLEESHELGLGPAPYFHGD